MLNFKEYAFVLDANGQQLDPTRVNNAWRLVRQKKAKLISKFPIVIQLNKVVNNLNQDKFFLGIDDGSVHVGIALVQKCLIKNKVLFKGVLNKGKMFTSSWNREKPIAVIIGIINGFVLKDLIIVLHLKGQCG